MLLLLCVSIYAFHTLIKWQKLFAVAQLAPIIYLLQAIVFWQLWFGDVFTIRFVGSPPFLLILSGQAKYFFIPFKGTSKPNKKQNKQNKNILNKIQFKKKKLKKQKGPCINDSKFKRAPQQTDNTDIINIIR